MKIQLDQNALTPTRAHETDAGLDLRSMENGLIFPKSHKVFRTGLHAEIPRNCVGMLTSKSGLMSKGITSRGTIDSGFTGDIRAVLFNHSWWFKRIRKGQKITQLVIMPIITPPLELVDSLEETDRGDNGFGSTGR